MSTIEKAISIDTDVERAVEEILEAVENDEFGECTVEDVLRAAPGRCPRYRRLTDSQQQQAGDVVRAMLP